MFTGQTLARALIPRGIFLLLLEECFSIPFLSWGSAGICGCGLTILKKRLHTCRYELVEAIGAQRWQVGAFGSRPPLFFSNRWRAKSGLRMRSRWKPKPRKA